MQGSLEGFYFVIPCDNWWNAKQGQVGQRVGADFYLVTVYAYDDERLEQLSGLQEVMSLDTLKDYYFFETAISLDKAVVAMSTNPNV